MLKYPCLVLDHDDTVVQTEKVLGYPYFCKILPEFRPGATISFYDYVHDCHNIGFANMCRMRFNFNDYELHDEYIRWMEHVKTNIPAPFPGIADLIHRQKQEGCYYISTFRLRFHRR